MAGTRKKKIKAKIKKKKPVCEEIDGWRIGDIAWGKTQLGEILHGEIETLHDCDQVTSSGKNLGKAVTLVTMVDGKYRTVLVSTLSENRIKKSRSKV